MKIFAAWMKRNEIREAILDNSAGAASGV